MTKQDKSHAVAALLKMLKNGGSERAAVYKSAKQVPGSEILSAAIYEFERNLLKQEMIDNLSSDELYSMFIPKYKEKYIADMYRLAPSQLILRFTPIGKELFANGSREIVINTETGETGEIQY